MHLCERTKFTKNNKNNEIAINTKEQTVYILHHSNRPVALASMNIIIIIIIRNLYSAIIVRRLYECVQNETFYETSNYIVFSGCATSLFLNSLVTSEISQSCSSCLSNQDYKVCTEVLTA